MASLEIARRIFVVGVPRSGTTLVQSLLAAHRELASFTESHFLSRYFKPLPIWPWALLTRDPKPRVRDFLAENRVEPSKIEAISTNLPGSRILLPLKTRAVAKRLLAILDQIARQEGRAGWVEKTPRHLRYIPFLERHSAGQMHFVHVIRDGLETVASLYKASQKWERAYDLDTCVARWNADVAFSLSRQRRGTAGDHFVFYEQLTDQPETTLRRLLQALGLDWQPDLLESYDSRRLVTAEETWKAGVDRGIRRSATSEHVLSESQRRRAHEGLRHDLYAQIMKGNS